MHIWHYTKLSPDQIGGVEKHIAALSHIFSKKGYLVSIGLKQPAIKSEEKLILHTHGDAWPSFKLLKLHYQHSLKWVHVCHGTSAGRVLACREFFSFSGLKGSLRDFSLVQCADAIIGVSQNAVLEAEKYFQYKGAFQIISNGVDPTIFKPLSQIVSDPRLIYVGRMNDRVKNLDMLLYASELLANKNSKYELWLAPGFKNHSHSYIKNLGKQDGRKLFEALSQCRALILCSFYEGNPLVVYEAMAVGLPILASDIPALREVLANYSLVTFFNPRKLQDVVMKIESVLNQDNFTPTPFVRSWDEVAQDYIRFYETL